jgi:nicotinamidase-related amidase
MPWTWRERGAPIIHVRHESPPEEGVFLAGTPGVEFKPEATPLPGEPVITKHVNSAFIGTDLEERLRARRAPVTTSRADPPRRRAGSRRGWAHRR